MSGGTYTEPRLAVLVLDFAKPIETRVCLESVKRHVKVPHTVILCDNGSGEDYPLQFVREGLADQLIVNRYSRGLGLGTRDVFALTFAYWSLYLQNDQFFTRDLTADEFDAMVSWMGGRDARGHTVTSISLAGAQCGPGTYSERAHLISTAIYKRWEDTLHLGHHGAGPWHNGEWREAKIQREYSVMHQTHLAWPHPLVQDNGVFAVREMGDAGLWCHRTDSKLAWCIRPPITRNPAYPKLNDAEWTLAETGAWPNGGMIPEAEKKDSFDCWSNTPLGRMQEEYIADLRRRKGPKTT